MNLSIGLAVDLLLLLIILWKLVSGVRSGAVRMLGGLVSLGCGIYGGILLRALLAKPLGEQVLAPAIRRALDKAMDNLGLSDILENLGSILNNAELPEFLKLDVIRETAVRMQENGATAVANATDLIAQRLAGWILFLLGLIIITILIRLLFSGVIAPLIDNIPLVNEANRILGGAIGAALGILMAGLLLCLCYRLLPTLSEKAGQIFAEDSIQGSILMKQYFRLFPAAFRG